MAIVKSKVHFDESLDPIQDKVNRTLTTFLFHWMLQVKPIEFT